MNPSPSDFVLGEMHDITAPKAVQIMIRRDGKVVWVNVDGRCVFRACQIEVLEVEDLREDASGESIQPQSGN